MLLHFAMKTLLPGQKQDMFIALVFDSIQPSHLVHMSFEATATHGIISYCEYLVTMAIETYNLFNGIHTSYLLQRSLAT